MDDEGLMKALAAGIGLVSALWLILLVTLIIF